MHEHHSTDMAHVRERTRSTLECRQTQCSDSALPVAASSTLHGAGMADSTQPPTCSPKYASRAPSDMDGIRPSGDEHCQRQGQPREEERLASLGHATHECGKPLHPQEAEELVIPAKPHGPVTTQNVLRLLEHQQYRCALTGRRLTPELAALDHIVPIRCNGEHVIENTQVLHKDVNRSKGSLTSEEFIGVCREVVEWSDTVIARKEIR